MSNTESRRAFSNIPFTSERPPKPRNYGISETCDWGIPHGQLRDYLDHTGEFVDVAKIVLGFAGLYPLDKLQEKIGIYKDANVRVQSGGIYFEYAARLGLIPQFLEHCHEAGFDYVEVSESRSDWTREERNAHVKSVVDAGHNVIPECGGGTQHSVQEVVDDVKSLLDLGAWKVTIDTAEIRAPDGEIRQDLFDALLAEMEMHDLIIELWALPIWGGRTHQIRDSELWLIDQLGPEVNIANLQFEWVFALEALRRGMGLNINSRSGGLSYD